MRSASAVSPDSSSRSMESHSADILSRSFLLTGCSFSRFGIVIGSVLGANGRAQLRKRDRTIAPVRHSPERVSRASEAPCVVHECRAARQLQHWVRRPLTRQPSPETKPAAELGRSAAARHPPEPRLSDAPWGKGHPKSPRRGGRPTARDLPPCKHSRKGDRRVLMTTCADHAGGGRTSCSPARP